jgi:hypothetical protein
VSVEHEGLRGIGETGGFETGHRAPSRPSSRCWRRSHPRPAVVSTWPCTTGGASGWGCRCSGSGAWIRGWVSPPA